MAVLITPLLSDLVVLRLSEDILRIFVPQLSASEMKLPVIVVLTCYALQDCNDVRLRAEAVCFTGSAKLGIPGYKLTLEEDGTDIDDDDMLLYVLKKEKILMLLCQEQRWKPAGGILL